MEDNTGKDKKSIFSAGSSGGGSLFSFFKPKEAAQAAPPVSPAPSPSPAPAETQELKKHVLELEQRLAALEARPPAAPAAAGPGASEEIGALGSDIKSLQGQLRSLSDAVAHAGEDNRVRAGKLEGALEEFRGKLQGIYQAMLLALGGENGKKSGPAEADPAAIAQSFALRLKLFEKMYQELCRFHSRSETFASRLDDAEMKLIGVSAELGRLNEFLPPLAAEISALQGLDRKLSPALELSPRVTELDSRMTALAGEVFRLSAALKGLSETSGADIRDLKKGQDRVQEVEMRLQNISVVFNYLRASLSGVSGKPGAGSTLDSPGREGKC